MQLERMWQVDLLKITIAQHPLYNILIFTHDNNSTDAL